MAALLTSEEENAAETFLREIQDTQNEVAAKDEAIRFLMARKFDVKSSIDLYVAHKLMREREGINLDESHIDSIKRELSSDKFTILEGRDTDGAAIALFRARFHHPLVTTHQATLRALILQLDTALHSVETQRNGLVFVFDMISSHFNNFDFELSTKILNMLKGGYPSRLKKVLIVTAPLWFKAPFKFLRMFVREKLRERVFTIERKSLLMHIPIATLPVYLGGDAEPFHKKWVSICLSQLNTSMDISAYLEGASVCDSPLSSTVSSICEHDMAPDSPVLSNGRKRNYASDTPPSPSDTPSSRRRGSSISASSLHQPSTNGMRAVDLVQYCRVKSKLGLIDEYNQMKMTEEPINFISSKVAERGRVKCGQYWPMEEGSVHRHAYLEVTCERVTDYNDFILTRLAVHNRLTLEKREVTHMQFTSWPDYGVPECAQGLLSFLELARETQKGAWLRLLSGGGDNSVVEPPIVVHCSAGIGRTGTFMTVDIAVASLQDCGRCDVNRTVRRIRSQRAYSIQMPEQYCFCHTAVVEYARGHELLTPRQADLTGYDRLPADTSSELSSEDAT